MDIALVTGADAGPGLAIARRLIGMGCRVYALATQFARNPFPHDDFIPLTCDLANPEAVTKAAEDVLAREGQVNFVVHAARRVATPLFDSPVSALAERVNVGLLAPLALVRATLPLLRKTQGHFLVLCWNGEGAAPGGPVTAAIEGGLHHFADELFEEMRSDGVRVTTLYARPNAETSPEAAMALDPQSAVNPELVADAVEQLLRQRPSNVISTLIIRPAAATESPRIARSSELAGMVVRDVQLPPRQNFPEEPEPIPTPKRERPADAPPPSAEDFEEEDEEDDWDPEAEPLPWAPDREGPPGEAPRSENRGPSGQPGAPRPQQGQGRGYDNRGPAQGQGRGQGRGRRRGGRGRGRGREQFGDRPQGGPPRQGDAPHSPPPPAADYPDAEQETQDRAFARDDSFRTPHDDSEEDHAPGTGEVSREGDFERSDDTGSNPPDHRDAPHSGASEPRSPQGGAPSRSPQQHGHGPRRHRLPSRRPPPGGGVGPGRD